MTKMPDQFFLSIIVPFYRESGTVDTFFSIAIPVFEKITENFEVIAVDDGSDDDTWIRLLSAADADSHISLIRLSRNYGHQAALTAGIDHARGDAVVIMDGDLQDPPEIVPQMVDAWKSGADIVNAVRGNRIGEGMFKRISAAVFYRIINALSEEELPLDTGDFRLVDRKAILAIRSMKEQHRYLRGMFATLGFKQSTVQFDRDARAEGDTKYSNFKMLSLALNGVFSFSRKPLQLASLLGGGFSSIACCYLLWVLFRALFFRGELVGGWASLITVVLLIGGLQLMCIGIIGEYVGRIFEEVKGRPNYLIGERKGFPELPQESPLPPTLYSAIDDS